MAILGAYLTEKLREPEQIHHMMAVMKYNLVSS